LCPNQRINWLLLLLFQAINPDHADPLAAVFDVGSDWLTPVRILSIDATFVAHSSPLTSPDCS
jgi:hypothetical protein